MIFRNFPENVLGSRVRVKVLMYMLAEGTPTSERELSRILDVSHMAVSKSMKRFHELNLVLPLRIGNVISWRLNKRGYAYEAITNIKEVMAKKPPLEDLRSLLIQRLLGRDLKMARIFGSVAEGREEPDSDIDLLIVADGGKQKAVKRVVDELSETCLQRYGNRLSTYMITEREAREPANRKIVKSAERGISVI